ncbi:MAG: transposase [Bacillales bacterium]|nr:transposase [Bacillales bacterium]
MQWIDAVNEVVMKQRSKIQVSREFGISLPVIKRWVSRFEKHGIEGLLMKRGSYTGEFKVHVINYMHQNHLSLFQTATHFGIPSDATVGIWERIYLEEGPEVLFKDNRGRKKMGQVRGRKKKLEKVVEEDLIAEVQRLRMENEYLKKLNALVQEREKSAKKTKF